MKSIIVLIYYLVVLACIISGFVYQQLGEELKAIHFNVLAILGLLLVYRTEDKL